MGKERYYTKKPKPKVKIKDQIKEYFRENPAQIPLVLSAITNAIMMPGSLLLPVENSNNYINYFLIGMGASISTMVVYEVCKKACRACKRENQSTSTQNEDLSPLPSPPPQEAHIEASEIVVLIKKPEGLELNIEENLEGKTKISIKKA